MRLLEAMERCRKSLTRDPVESVRRAREDGRVRNEEEEGIFTP